MEWFADSLRHYPELAIFLTLGLGYWVGALKLGSFSLGAVTGTLLAGVLIGQLGITISPTVKSVFFLMFLFAVGYGVGPQFFRGLKSDGLPQVLFAVVICVLCLLVTLGLRGGRRVRRRDRGRAALRRPDDFRGDRSGIGHDQRPRPRRRTRRRSWSTTSRWPTR